MTKDEALKLALEALELEDLACRYEKEPTPEHIAKAITAIREALAQPAQEPVQCWKCGDMDAEFQAKCDVPACGMKETKQKPVACPMCKEWEAVCDQHLRHIKKLKKQREPLTD